MNRPLTRIISRCLAYSALVAGIFQLWGVIGSQFILDLQLAGPSSNPDLSNAIAVVIALAIYLAQIITSLGLSAAVMDLIDDGYDEDRVRACLHACKGHDTERVRAAIRACESIPTEQLRRCGGKLVFEDDVWKGFEGQTIKPGGHVGFDGLPASAIAVAHDSCGLPADAKAVQLNNEIER